MTHPEKKRTNTQRKKTAQTQQSHAKSSYSPQEVEEILLSDPERFKTECSELQREINGFLTLFPDKENTHRNLDEMFMIYMDKVLELPLDTEGIHETVALFCHLQTYLRSMEIEHHF